jgi:hypothetical protein
MLIADFHIHSNFSRDSFLSPLFIVKSLRAKGYSVIGIADHNTTEGALLAKRLNPYKDVLVLVGQEVKTPQGEIIVFGCKENLYGKNIYEILDIAKTEDFLTIVPHPFDFMRRNSICRKLAKGEMKEILRKVDAIECFNARCLLPWFNKKAREFAAREKKPCVCGSDAHTPGELGKVRNIIHCEFGEDEIIQAIRKRKVEIKGSYTFLYVHAKSFLYRTLNFWRRREKTMGTATVNTAVEAISTE